MKDRMRMVFIVIINMRMNLYMDKVRNNIFYNYFYIRIDQVTTESMYYYTNISHP